MARCTSAAATAESTPPDSPQIARLSPTWARICCDLLVDDVGHRPGRAGSRRCRSRKWLSTCLAVLGVQHLGVELHAGEPRGRGPRTPRPGVAAGRRRARRSRRAPRRPRRRGTSTPCAAAARRRAACRARATSSGVRPNSERPVRRDLAAERLRHRLEAVADAEHRDAGVEQAGVDAAGRRRLVDRRRAAGEDDRLRLARPASPPPASCAGRSRSRPGPRARGGRSAGRTGRRSRRRGRGRGRWSLLGHRDPSVAGGGEAVSLSGSRRTPAQGAPTRLTGPSCPMWAISPTERSPGGGSAPRVPHVGAVRGGRLMGADLAAPVEVRLSLALLGPLSARLAGEDLNLGGRRQRAVVALLVLARGRQVVDLGPARRAVGGRAAAVRRRQPAVLRLPPASRARAAPARPGPEPGARLPRRRLRAGRAAPSSVDAWRFERLVVEAGAGGGRAVGASSCSRRRWRCGAARPTLSTPAAAGPTPRPRRLERAPRRSRASGCWRPGSTPARAPLVVPELEALRRRGPAARGALAAAGAGAVPRAPAGRRAARRCGGPGRPWPRSSGSTRGRRCATLEARGAGAVAGARRPPRRAGRSWPRRQRSGPARALEPRARSHRRPGRVASTSWQRRLPRHAWPGRAGPGADRGTGRHRQDQAARPRPARRAPGQRRDRARRPRQPAGAGVRLRRGPPAVRAGCSPTPAPRAELLPAPRPRPPGCSTRPSAPRRAPPTRRSPCCTGSTG